MEILNNEAVVFSLSANKALTDEVCAILKIKKGEVAISRFADGEIDIKTNTSVRGKIVYIIQSTSNPVNENLMELLIMIDALKRASAKQINAVIPYFGYARQDRKAQGRQPITCKLVANLLTIAGVNRVITLDLHSPQEQGFFDVPVDDLRASQLLIEHMMTQDFKHSEVVIVAPDHGGTIRARVVADILKTPIAVIDKRRKSPNQSEVQFILGEVQGKVAIMIDDMIDTGGTIINGAKALKEKGAKAIYVVATHGLFSQNAKTNFETAIAANLIKEVIVTNTIEIKPEQQFKGLKVVSIGRFLAQMIYSSVQNSSLTEVYFENRAKICSKIETWIQQ